MSFSINCLEITATREQWIASKSLYKNLLSEKDYDDFDESRINPDEAFKKRFFFNDFYLHNQHGNLERCPQEKRLDSDLFFEKNINIQAIVGQNGSGKSSLMDLLYMVINNFSFMFERGKDRHGADPLYYIPDLRVNLYFSIKNSISHDGEYVLQNAADNVDLLNEKKESIVKKIYGKDKFSLNEAVEASSSDASIAKLVQYFFYTIVTNYSMQSFISSNYIQDLKCYKNNSIADVSDQSWIDSIFHKNDGYIRSIVLNPYRNYGVLDCSNELVLSKDRLLSLLIFSEQLNKNKESKAKIELFEPYSFKKLLINQKENFLCRKFRGVLKKVLFPLQKEFEEYNQVIAKFKDDADVLSIINSQLERKICDKFHCSQSELKLKKVAFAYFVIKMIDIVNKYSDYSSFRNDIFFIRKEDSSIDIGYNKDGIDVLLDKIDNDYSHVTKKLRRILTFLYLDDGIVSLKMNDKFEWRDYKRAVHKFYYDKLNILDDPNHNYFLKKNPFGATLLLLDADEVDFTDPSRIDETLPPSLFEYEIFLNKSILQNGGENTKIEVDYKELSSGELQYLQTLSVHCYHVENILSIPFNNERPKYMCVNLIFDEIELCFHPEYQRMFVFRLINMLKAMRQNYDPNTGGVFINVMIITHSPFVLSDIPKENILYLKDGRQEERYGETFAGNLGELLESGFFLNGTIGNFAGWKINRLIENIEKGTVSENDRLFVEKIGDSLLKSLLKRKLPREVCNDKN